MNLKLKIYEIIFHWLHPETEILDYEMSTYKLIQIQRFVAVITLSAMQATEHYS